jgi:hypothetical protein
MNVYDHEDFSWQACVTPIEPEPTREAWLCAAIDRMARSVFPPFKQPKWRVTCGWPKGVRGGKHAIGQCWDRSRSDDGAYEIFVSPELDQPVEILHVLAHEMIHAIAGIEAGHQGEFVRLCKAIGLQKPWTATTPNAALSRMLAIFALQLGPYPHARLNDLHKKQGTRMLKATCPNPDCEVRLNVAGNKPYTVRITQQWADAGMPSCPCGALMVLAGQESEQLSEAA